MGNRVLTTKPRPWCLACTHISYGHSLLGIKPQSLLSSTSPLPHAVCYFGPQQLHRLLIAEFGLKLLHISWYFILKSCSCHSRCHGKIQAILSKAFSPRRHIQKLRVSSPMLFTSNSSTLFPRPLFSPPCQCASWPWFKLHTINQFRNFCEDARCPSLLGSTPSRLEISDRGDFWA